jgi:hypothetical protein
MKLDKLVELGDIINRGKFHSDRANSSGSAECPCKALIVGKRSRP